MAFVPLNIASAASTSDDAARLGDDARQTPAGVEPRFAAPGPREAALDVAASIVETQVTDEHASFTNLARNAAHCSEISRLNKPKNFVGASRSLRDGPYDSNASLA